MFCQILQELEFMFEKRKERLVNGHLLGRNARRSYIAVYETITH